MLEKWDFSEKSLLATGSISIAELQNIRQTMKLPADVCKKIDELCQESDEHNINYFRSSSLTFDDTTYEAITNIGNMKSDLLDLIQATYFACDGNQIYFLYEKPMPNRKVILFSATIDPMLYHRLYANREIKTSQCAKVAYM